MSRSSTLYALAGILFLLAFALNLPHPELHGWLFLAVSLANFGMALHHARVERQAQG